MASTHRVVVGHGKLTNKKVLAMKEQVGMSEEVDWPPPARRDDWLHGWPRRDKTVLIGSMVCCVGCGKAHGITSIALEEGWESFVLNRPMPTWPFEVDNCPVCVSAEDL